MAIEPISRTTLVQSVIDELVAFILENDLKPGDKLPSQQELMAQFKVGRSTVRESLKSLAAMGLIDMRAGYGTYVKELDAKSIIRPDILALMIDEKSTERLLEAREIIEPEIAYLAVQRATDNDLAAIRAILDECEEAIQAEEPVFRLSSAFHRAVTEAAHNEILLMFMDSILRLLVERGWLLENRSGFPEWELESHREIYQHIAQRNGQKARTAMARHVEESSTALLEMLHVPNNQGN